MSAEDLVTDLAVAQELLDNPPALSPSGQWDAPVAVAAAALEAHIMSGVELPIEALRFAAETVIRIGTERSVTTSIRVRGVVLRTRRRPQRGPRASPASSCRMRRRSAPSSTLEDGSETYSRAAAAAGNIARSLANEVRVHLARGLDRLWEAPCTGDGTCHHRHGAPTRRRDDARLRLRGMGSGHRQTPSHRAR